jgi:hypothetical protein
MTQGLVEWKQFRKKRRSAMSLSEIILEGTIKQDGTLELDQKPSLSPGRVTVILRQESGPLPPPENWWQYLQRARRELEASGARFLNDEEMKAHGEWLREEDHIDKLLREADEYEGRQGQGSC